MRLNSFRSLLCLFAVASASSLSFGQLKTPAASPHATIKQVVGLTDVEIDYSRPGMKGRDIFGSLVPFGEVWRTGANQPTKLSFSDAVVLGGEKVDAGTYALYSIPGKQSWTIIISSKTDLWGAFGYDDKDDVVRFEVEPETLKNSVETFTIEIGEIGNEGATIYLDWAKTRIALSLEVPTDVKVMSQMEELKESDAFKNPNVLYAAGSYYFAAGKDLEQAHAWVSEACETMEKPAFWMFANKARIEVALGEKALAKESAEKTLALATEANNGDYQKIAKDILASL